MSLSLVSLSLSLNLFLSLFPLPLFLTHIFLFFSTEDIEDLLEETAEAVEKQREIDALISGQLTQVSLWLAMQL